MLFEMFHLLFLAGWIGDVGLLLFCIKKLFYLDPLCLLYFAYYVFVEYFDKLPFFDYISLVYINSYKNYFKYSRIHSLECNNLETIITTGEKKNIFIVGPHGVFMTSPIAIGIYNLQRKNANKFKLFVSPLVSMNPMVNLICKMIQNGNKVESLHHKNVIRNLKENKYNLCVSGGGFEEINMFNNTENVIYGDRWRYWIYSAIKHNYNINFCYLYGGTQDYRSVLNSTALLSLRRWFAKYYIPFNIVYGKFLLLPFNDIELTEVFFHLDLPYNPNITKEESSVYLDKFHQEVIKILETTKPKNGQHKLILIDR